ncbi:unnamed protein product [Spirodela intermedia]|uniref:Uncharacterized protein n=1 Tax=Spirodela intermedia TaxID=51605 RepID=A0ABN7ECS6_SPIIN|nr:unnamed protein product [Spirodela intermedia]
MFGGGKSKVMRGSLVLASRKKHNTLYNDGERDSSPSTQETLVVQVQPDRGVKMKEPGFCYMA